jgi:hypothetical protein
VHLDIELPGPLIAPLIGLVTGDDLPPVRFADADFEEPWGSSVALQTDLLGSRKQHGAAYPAGPLSTLSGGNASIRVW